MLVNMQSGLKGNEKLAAIVELDYLPFEGQEKYDLTSITLHCIALDKDLAQFVVLHCRHCVILVP